jgi:hypothetical protein
VTVADSENSVVKSGAALNGVENTGLVGLEDTLVSLDGDSNGVKGEGSLEGSNRIYCDVDATGDLNVGVGIGSIVITITTFSSVGVGFLGHGEVVRPVAEGPGLVTTVAT